MDIGQGIGHSTRDAIYTVPDHEMAVGSTLGGPAVCTVIKGNGAIEKIYSIESGSTIFGALVLHHWDEQTGMHLDPAIGGSFAIHPEHQERAFTLANGVAVHEDIFVLSARPHGGEPIDPPAVYYAVELRNNAKGAVRVATYAFCELRGDTSRDVEAAFDPDLAALIAWNRSRPGLVRIFGCSEPPASFEVSADYGAAVGAAWPGELANAATAVPADPLGVLHHSHTLEPGECVSFFYLLTFSLEGRDRAVETYRACPDAAGALERTVAYFEGMLGRSVVLTPNPEINRGVLWAKANMLRIMLKAPTGWCFVNDPTRSNNSVGRDTCWFGYGADYLVPEFARESLLAYVRLQEPSGMIVEYYDIRSEKTADYDLNINDNTPLLILALWHHYTVTGDMDFLREVYPAAARAARYILSQRNEQGLVWCTATGTSDWGIVGWRNVMQDYRLSGATTEVNSECFAALQHAAKMAEVLGQDDDRAAFSAEAEALKEAINAHLLNPRNGLYYLNIDVDGTPRSEVTSDLVFPVLFGVASEETAARIVRRLSSPDFWTEAGIRTAPRDAPNYSPGREPDYGLMGGVWVGVTFWYAFAAARFSPDSMDRGLATSFQNYSRNPRQNHTVPGQFSEWLHGETLVNEGMMLSPWFPPRYLWAAVEGTAGLDLSDGPPRLSPLLAPDWKWLGVQNLPFRGTALTWLALRMPDLQIFANHHFAGPLAYHVYEEDITERVHAADTASVSLGFRQGGRLLLFVGNTGDHTMTTALRVALELRGTYAMRVFDSLVGRWFEPGTVEAAALQRGITMPIERKGFRLLELEPKL